MPLLRQDQRPAPLRAERRDGLLFVRDGRAGPMALIDGTEAGPYPAEHNPDVMRLIGHNSPIKGT